LTVDYGLDSFFMQEGTAKPVENALRQRRRVQMQIAIASSGHARIRRLVVDGVPVGATYQSTTMGTMARQPPPRLQRSAEASREGGWGR
jgi:hypothetical protein